VVLDVLYHEERNTSAIATPAVAPNAAIPASAI